VGEAFTCELSGSGYASLQKLLMSPVAPAPKENQCDAKRTCPEHAPRIGARVAAGGREVAPLSCAECWEFRADCSAKPGCSKDACDFCE
jgi:hypothetical protein